MDEATKQNKTKKIGHIKPLANTVLVNVVTIFQQLLLLAMCVCEYVYVCISKKGNNNNNNNNNSNNNVTL